jgi:tetratricopeptide (TPR) repeat protein
MSVAATFSMHAIMRPSLLRAISHGAASALILTSFITLATAADSDVSNVDLCNGGSNTLPDRQIEGCTALLKSADNEKVLAIIYNNRGNGYVGKGQYDLAIKDYEEAIKNDPEYAKPYNNRGVAYQKKAEYDLAVKDFNAALQLDPDYANALANRAETYLKEADYQNAAKDFDRAIRLQPKLTLLPNERCWARAIIGDDLPSALSDCNAAIQSTPRDPAPLDSRGLIYLKNSQWDAAITDYNAALSIDPKIASSLYGRGLAKLRKGNAGAANADIAAAKNINPNIVDEFSRYGIK